MQFLGSGPRLPDEPWPLTAPESYVLRYGLGNNAHGLHAFKLALTELVARRALDLRGAWVRRRWAPGRYPTFLLCDGPHKGAVEERSLRPVVELHTNMKRRSLGVPFDDPAGEAHGVLLTRFASVAARAGGYRTYLERDVAPSLRQRELLSSVNARTPAGNRAFEQLDAWMEVTRRGLFGWSHDETWLRAFVAGAGASVFLTQFATPGQPVLKHIGSRWRPSRRTTCPTLWRTGTPAGWTSEASPTAWAAPSTCSARDSSTPASAAEEVTAAAVAASPAPEGYQA